MKRGAQENFRYRATDTTHWWLLSPDRHPPNHEREMRRFRMKVNVRASKCKFIKVNAKLYATLLIVLSAGCKPAPGKEEKAPKVQAPVRFEIGKFTHSGPKGDPVHIVRFLGPPWPIIQMARGEACDSFAHDHAKLNSIFEFGGLPKVAPPGQNKGCMLKKRRFNSHYNFVAPDSTLVTIETRKCLNMLCVYKITHDTGRKYYQRTHE